MFRPLSGAGQEIGVWERYSICLIGGNISFEGESPSRKANEGASPLAKGMGSSVHIIVRDNNVDQALRALKKKMQREGIFREMKLRRSFEKPSEKRARERAEAVRRHRKMLRKRLEREGY